MSEEGGKEGGSHDATGGISPCSASASCVAGVFFTRANCRESDLEASSPSILMLASSCKALGDLRLDLNDSYSCKQAASDVKILLQHPDTPSHFPYPFLCLPLSIASMLPPPLCFPADSPPSPQCSCMSSLPSFPSARLCFLPTAVSGRADVTQRDLGRGTPEDHGLRPAGRFPCALDGGSRGSGSDLIDVHIIWVEGPLEGLDCKVWQDCDNRRE